MVNDLYSTITQHGLYETKQKIMQYMCTNKNVSFVHGCPIFTINFYVQWAVNSGQTSNLALQ